MTGFAAADTLVELGAHVTVVAERGDAERERILTVLGVESIVVDASQTPQALADAELVIASPGLAPTHPWLVGAAERGQTVWGDVELAWRVRDKVRAAEWLLVTATRCRCWRSR